MSYPPERYLGDAGEVSAVHRPAAVPAEVRTPASAAAYLASGATTGGDFGLYRWDMSGPPTGPGPHFHRTLSESFFILSGTVRIHTGERWVDTGPGDFIHVPPGGIHGFRNESGGPASMLILFTPGAPREGYFEGLAEIANGGALLSEQAMAEFYLRHDNHWL
ncbi:MAG: cupin domain-containing protein [Kineosporiaceae bacterium]|jgi:mannose-6-phosphate isomerase-like protein (cupin superfamily)